MSYFSRLRGLDPNKIDFSRIQNSSLERMIRSCLRKTPEGFVFYKRKGHEDHKEHSDAELRGSDSKFPEHSDNYYHRDHTDHNDYHIERHSDQGYTEGPHHTDSNSYSHTDTTKRVHIDERGS